MKYRVKTVNAIDFCSDLHGNLLQKVPFCWTTKRRKAWKMSINSMTEQVRFVQRFASNGKIKLKIKVHSL